MTADGAKTFGSKTFSFRVNWFVLILVVAAALIAAFILKPEWRPVLLFVAPVLGGSAALLAAYNAIDARLAGAEQAKKAVSLQFLHCWLNPSFSQPRKHGYEILAFLKANHNVVDQKKWLEEDPSRLASLFDILNVFETMSSCIQEDLADAKLLERSFRSLVREYWHASSAFVKARRDERNNARLLREVEWLFNQWKD
ncbi:MAG: DUF4760 domain-containing protein [Gemmatimonadales bacterium]|nr:DUF4760 domain-containing protein [Gemmatimonadales bacterium]